MKMKMKKPESQPNKKTVTLSRPFLGKACRQTNALKLMLLFFCISEEKEKTGVSVHASTKLAGYNYGGGSRLVAACLLGWAALGWVFFSFECWYCGSFASLNFSSVDQAFHPNTLSNLVTIE